MKKAKTAVLLTLILISFLLYHIRLRAASPHSAHQFISLSENLISDSSITVLNWNIHKEVSNEIWAEDFSSMINLHVPDIITLQEARSNEQFQSVLGDQRGYVFAPNVENRKGNSSGVLTASSANPESFSYSLTENYEPLLNTPKVYLTTTYKLSPSNQKLQVINVHGINFVSLKKFIQQMTSIEESIQNHAGPQLVIGDFNTWKQSRLDILSAIAHRQNLSQVKFANGDSSEVKQFMNNPLDHILHSNDLQLKLNSSDVLEHITSSDHKPLLATFVLSLAQIE